ncbi:hypothetical protein [Streptomyces sp. NPDC008317]|uniref:hypothetical protein n=1 Tax=Streptomyces sp. NPDC008317 TaxID=3364827 RepID=UPI0036E8D1FD
MALGTIGGPLLGGFVTGHLGGRWAFSVNLPLGLLALVWCQVMLRLPAARCPLPAARCPLPTTRLPRQGQDRLARHRPHDLRPLLGRARRDLGGQPLRRGLLANRRAGRRRRARPGCFCRLAAPRARTRPAVAGVRHPQRPALVNDDLRGGRRDVRCHARSAAVPAERPGRVGHQLRPVRGSAC